MSMTWGGDEFRDSTVEVFRNISQGQNLECTNIASYNARTEHCQRNISQEMCIPAPCLRRLGKSQLS